MGRCVETNIITTCGFVESNWRIYKGNLDVRDSITRNLLPAGIVVGLIVKSAHILSTKMQVC